MNACQRQPPVTLWGATQVNAWYSEVVVELYCNWLLRTIANTLVSALFIAVLRIYSPYSNVFC